MAERIIPTDMFAEELNLEADDYFVQSNQPCAPDFFNGGYVGACPPAPSFTFSVDKNTVTFDASASTTMTPEGVQTYSWDFGDGQSAAGAAPVHVFSASGAYTVTLTVTDHHGYSGSLSKQVETSVEIVSFDASTVVPSSHSFDPQVTSVAATFPAVAAGDRLLAFVVAFDDNVADGRAPTTALSGYSDDWEAVGDGQPLLVDQGQSQYTGYVDQGWLLTAVVPESGVAPPLQCDFTEGCWVGVTVVRARSTGGFTGFVADMDTGLKNSWADTDPMFTVSLDTVAPEGAALLIPALKQREEDTWQFTSMDGRVSGADQFAGSHNNWTVAYKMLPTGGVVGDHPVDNPPTTDYAGCSFGWLLLLQ